MNRQEIEEALRHTLQDHKLTGGEKHALREVLQERPPGESERAFLRQRAFEMAREAVGDPVANQVLGWLEETVKVLQPSAANQHSQATQSEACFSEEHDCVRKIVHLFGEARQKVDICVFTITDDRIASAILDAHRRNVALRLISDNEKAYDLGSDIQRLAAAGIAVRVDHTEYHMHHKYAVFDNSRVLTGSFNWTRSAAEHNLENFVITSDPGLVSAFAGAFDRLWKRLG